MATSAEVCSDKVTPGEASIGTHGDPCFRWAPSTEAQTASQHWEAG